ncbi:MAG: cytochrome C [Leptospirillia bacterium]
MRTPGKRVGMLGGAVLLIVVGVVLSAGGRLLEDRPGFCLSCHEMAFYGKTWQSSGAALHHGRCIDCHSGPGVVGAVSAQMTGLEELARHFFGHPFPARSYHPGGVPNANCLKCHVRGYARLAHRNFSVAGRECAVCHNHFDDQNFSGEVPLSMRHYERYILTRRLH